MNEIVIFYNEEVFFFSNDPLQRFNSKVPLHDDFLSTSFSLPYNTEEKHYECIRRNLHNIKEIPNPDPLFRC